MRAGLVALAVAYALSQSYRAFLAVLAPLLQAEIGTTAEDSRLRVGTVVRHLRDHADPRRPRPRHHRPPAHRGRPPVQRRPRSRGLRHRLRTPGGGGGDGTDRDRLRAGLDGGLLHLRPRLPAKVFASLGGLLIGVSSVGDIASTVPMAWAAEAFGWRACFWAIAGFTAVIAGAILALVRNPPRLSVPEGAGGIGRIFRSPAVLLLLPLVLVHYAQRPAGAGGGGAARGRALAATEAVGRPGGDRAQGRGRPRGRDRDRPAPRRGRGAAGARGRRRLGRGRPRGAARLCRGEPPSRRRGFPRPGCLDNASPSYAGDAGLGKTPGVRALLEEPGRHPRGRPALRRDPDRRLHALRHPADGGDADPRPRLRRRAQQSPHRHPPRPRPPRPLLPRARRASASPTPAAGPARTEAAHGDWQASLATPPQPGALDMGEVVRHLQAMLPADAILTNGAGNFATWTNKHFAFTAASASSPRSRARWATASPRRSRRRSPVRTPWSR